MKKRTPRGKNLSEKEIIRRELQAGKYSFPKKIQSLPVRGTALLFFLIVILPPSVLLFLAIYK